MITQEQADTATMFHSNLVKNSDGSCQRWRRNGQTKRWKRTPERFKIPVKFGLYAYNYLTETDAPYFHVEEDCDGR